MKITNELAELVGIMYGDGCLSRSCKKYNVYVCGHKFDDFEYHDTIIRKLFLDLFNKITHISKKKNENTLYIKNSNLAKAFDKNFKEAWRSIPEKWLSGNPRAESKDSLGSCYDFIDNDHDNKVDECGKWE